MAVKGVTNNPDGGPVKIEVTPAVIEEAAALYGLGVTQETVADALGISVATLKRYMVKHPELKTAMFGRLTAAKKALAGKWWKMLLSDKCPPNVFILGLKHFLGVNTDRPEVNVNLSSTDLVLESMKVANRPDQLTIEESTGATEQKHTGKFKSET